MPTIGHIYQTRPLGRPCIIYFNGLGLPIDPSPAALSSDRHWFNRVWTLQETLFTWFPGGVSALADAVPLTRQLQCLIANLYIRDGQTNILHAARTRHCSAELDRLMGLAYHLACDTLPLYDTTIPIETAWSMLLKHAAPFVRTLFFLVYPVDTPFGLWTSWGGLLRCPAQQLQPTSLAPQPNSVESLQLVDPSQLDVNEPADYHHTVYALEPCYITCLADAGHTFRLTFSGSNSSSPAVVTIHPIGYQGQVHLPGVAYHLLGLAEITWKRFWIVAEVVGQRNLPKGNIALEAIKWGVIQLNEDDNRKLVATVLAGKHVTIVYLSSEAALSRSKYVDAYLEAFVMSSQGPKRL